MTTFRVLALRETTRRSDDHTPVSVWVALGLEWFIATQVSPDETWEDAVAALGDMFDARDAFTRVHARDLAEDPAMVEFEPPPPAPSEYEHMYANAEPVGTFRLGSMRFAEVRLLQRDKT